MNFIKLYGLNIAYSLFAGKILIEKVSNYGLQKIGIIEIDWNDDKNCTNEAIEQKVSNFVLDYTK